MKKIKVITVLFVLVLSSCKKDDKGSVSMNQPPNNFGKTIEKIYSGDTIEYKRYRDYNDLEGVPEDFFYYALMMANRYDFDEAYLDVFNCFKNDSSGLSFSERDKKTQKLMLQYLNEAVKRNVDGAKEMLQEINNPKKEEIDNGEAKG